eukprot:CAMPEP_0197894884 /NCGR_PEP_ID=MMETSP1439-20131203/36067_1 /TAXON_ID=66791 /ORGANISM="Gonyaulax spinifera, Strain CCMP409" /LENGTH=53 /DNA_ID=CAMNT_0043515271 /DNA_START=20 /DNA_END=177 /DNA_ORIENTATION=-
MSGARTLREGDWSPDQTSPVGAAAVSSRVFWAASLLGQQIISASNCWGRMRHP